MLTEIKTKIQTWNKSRKHKQNYIEEEEVASQFQVKEIGGELYLTCNGTPYKSIEQGATAKDVVEYLTEARQSALKYRKQRSNPYSYMHLQLEDASIGHLVTR